MTAPAPFPEDNNWTDAVEKMINQLEPDNVDGYVIAEGHAFDGIELHGVFKSFDEAMAYTDGIDEDWHIVPIWKPET